MWLPPRSTLFPYTTLFRSRARDTKDLRRHRRKPSEGCIPRQSVRDRAARDLPNLARVVALVDRKSTRLNSSHVEISYAVFCLKKKTTNQIQPVLELSIKQP